MQSESKHRKRAVKTNEDLKLRKGTGHSKETSPKIPRANNKRLEIKPTTTLAEVLTIEGAYEELAKLGVPCIVCPLMGMEMHFLTLEGIAKMYNLDLKKILRKLNALL